MADDDDDSLGTFDGMIPKSRVICYTHSHSRRQFYRLRESIHSFQRSG